MKRILFTFILVLFFSSINRAQQDISSFQTEQFWRLSGRNAITWDLTTETKLPHADNIEMSGQKVAVIVTYEVDENRNLTVSRDVIFPQFRHYIESSANSWRSPLVWPPPVLATILPSASLINTPLVTWRLAR